MVVQEDFLGDFEQYAVKRDEHGTWRVLDRWNEAVRHLDSEADIPDSSPAVTIIPDAMFLALLKESARIGVLDKITKVLGNYVESQRVNDLEDEVDRLEGELRKKPQTPLETGSESYLLKKHIIDSILKLAAMEDVKETSS